MMLRRGERTMARYAQRLKDQAVARLLPPESAAVDRVAHD